VRMKLQILENWHYSKDALKFQPLIFMIDSVSRYLLENETMIIRARRLRQERMEVFGET
jgi:hypothetical protein